MPKGVLRLVCLIFIELAVSGRIQSRYVLLCEGASSWQCYRKKVVQKLMSEELIFNS
jgi:hypothetical protein